MRNSLKPSKMLFSFETYELPNTLSTFSQHASFANWSQAEVFGYYADSFSIFRKFFQQFPKLPKPLQQPNPAESIHTSTITAKATFVVIIHQNHKLFDKTCLNHFHVWEERDEERLKESNQQPVRRCLFQTRNQKQNQRFLLMFYILPYLASLIWSINE